MEYLVAMKVNGARGNKFCVFLSRIGGRNE